MASEQTLRVINQQLAILKTHLSAVSPPGCGNCALPLKVTSCQKIVTSPSLILEEFTCTWVGVPSTSLATIACSATRSKRTSVEASIQKMIL